MLLVVADTGPCCVRPLIKQEIDDVTAVFKKDLAELKREIDALQRYADAQTGRNTQVRPNHVAVE